MKTVGYICKKCGKKFEAKIFEKGEAEQKRVSTSQVRCPDCRGTNIEQR